MADPETLMRLYSVAEAVGQDHGGAVQKFQHPDGWWTVTIEPTGDRYGDWSIRAEGETEAHALSNLIREARGR